MPKNINKISFDEATKLKLEIFGECFEEWLPVFNNDRYTEKVYVFDFFAGSGTDENNNLGSPLILLEKSKGKEQRYCKNAKKEIKFFFNEGMKNKSRKLKENIDKYIQDCEEKNQCSRCIYNYEIINREFKEIFSDDEILNILQDGNIGKFVLLDQYGFKEINEDIFKQLIAFSKTDFIFFISSSFINRFKEHPHITKYIDTSKINFERQPKEIHRAIADYFRDLIPKKKEYYLHHFSIRKDINKGNYYGLIFGTSHTLGMEKFLKVCWKHDKFSGEANFNIDNNYESGSLFSSLGENVKKDTISQEINELVLSGKITDNITGLKYAMQKGCEPKLFTNVIKVLEKDKKIKRVGNLNYSSTNVHKVKEYKIERLKNGT